MSNFIIDPQRGPHIRDYSDQSQDRVIICSNTGYWAANGCGYTTSQMAGVYTRDDAYKRAGHCGPEKGCCFYDVTADHVPTLQAEVERLRAAVKLLREALGEAACWVPDGSYMTAVERGAKCETAGDMREMISIAITATAPKGEQGCQNKS